MKEKVSVITVSFNAVSSIQRTIDSVASQSYENIEYIVIDGGSKDGTLDIIKNNLDNISSWVSEPDKGIYDAMNKGISKATGDWLVFMNCGDTFYNIDVISEVMNLVPDSSVIYGDTDVVENFGDYILRPWPLDSLSRYIAPFFHQSSFIRADVMKQYFFDTRYKYCADFNLFFQLWKKGAKFQYIPQTFSKYDVCIGSASYDNALDVYKECFHIVGVRTLKGFLCFIRLLLAGLYKKVVHMSDSSRMKIIESNRFLKWKSW